LRAEQAIYDILVRAIRNGRKLIYIENQFFRSRAIARALADSRRQHPAMELIVVTNQITAPLRYAYGAAWHTWRAQQRVREVRPGFTLYQLLGRGRVGVENRYSPIEVHSKVMVVDDEWATVGSANLNERSILSETEANVAIEDAPFARALRCRLMAEHLGLSADDPRLQQQAEAGALWRALASANGEARRAGQLAPGHAHPFVQEPSWEMLKGRARWF
jgi:phosphatidylserine/phosphatidylglycerophosphate/cardiolipin synthase-like enzyme